MQPLNYLTLIAILVLAGCHGPEQQTKKAKGSKGFVLKETLATGDTGMTRMTSGFTKTDIRERLCQHWELENMEGASSIELVMDENNKRIYPQLNIFKDGSVLENPRNTIRIGQWRLTNNDTLLLDFPDDIKKYELRNITSRNLYLVSKGKTGIPLYLKLSSDGQVHNNMHNDPFHPVNNQWRIKPKQPESDSAIRARVLDCLKFYALYYRDNILRKKGTINFLGLPDIFNWYSGGIGLPDKEEVDSSWVNCFYNRQQSLEGYEILHRLIVDHEFNWPKAPAWIYQTHSVLEQMYHKLGE